MPRATFKRTERLVKEAEFRAALRQGFSLRRGLFRIVCLARPVPPSKMAVWIRRHVFRSAVERNRIKRWAREFFRTRKRRLSSPWFLIIQITAQAAADDHRAFDGELERALQEAGVMRP